MKKYMKLLVLSLVVTGLMLGAGSKFAGHTAADDNDTSFVDVALSDFTNFPVVGWAVVADPESVAEGNVVFDVTNINAGIPNIPHDLVVIRSDLAPDQLPRLGPGLGVDESQVDIVGRTPLLFSGETAQLNFDLDEGNYVLICNVNPEGITFAAHYEDGMYTGFTVRDEKGQRRWERIQNRIEKAEARLENVIAKLQEKADKARDKGNLEKAEKFENKILKKMEKHDERIAKLLEKLDD